MLRILYISLVCYMPILEMYLPKTDFGPGIPDLGPIRVFSYLLFLAFVFDSVVRKRTKFLFPWTFILAIYLAVVLASVSWSKQTYSLSVLQKIFETPWSFP